MSRANSVEDLAQYIAAALSACGVEVDLYRAQTTNSLYLTLDYGVLDRIRVSDHKGNGVRFGYEIGWHVTERHRAIKKTRGRTYFCEKFTADSALSLVDTIFAKRALLISQVSRAGYASMVEEARLAYESMTPETERVDTCLLRDVRVV